MEKEHENMSQSETANMKNSVDRTESSEEESVQSSSSDRDQSGNQLEEIEDASTFKNQIHEILKKVKNTGASEFVISGKLVDPPTVVLSIKSSGSRIKFPVFEEETASIITDFEKSPYGKGTETILDLTFRNSWQMDSEGFTILTSTWDEYMKEVVIPRIGKEMAITESFSASLYKLLLYKSGCFFKPHRDSEKEARMFGTLVVQLPSKYNGGELVVSQENTTKKIDLSSVANPANEFSTLFSAFYCDCKHEVLPVTDGVRVCLIYNLILTSNNENKIPSAIRSADTEIMMDNLLKDWNTKDDPSKIVYALSHQYTKKNLTMENLKSSDATVAQFLKKMATQNEIILLLGFLRKGIATVDAWNGYSNTSNYFELSDLKIVGGLENTKIKLKKLSLSYEDEAILPSCFEHFKEVGKELEETGNEGTHVHLFYCSAALVLIPMKSIIHHLVNERDYETAEKLFLSEFKKRQNEEAKMNLLGWANAIISSDSNRYSSKTLSLFSAFINFNNLELLQRFLTCYDIVRSIQYGGADGIIPLITSQCQKYGWQSFTVQLTDKFKKIESFKVAKSILKSIIEDANCDCQSDLNKNSICKLLVAKVVELWKKKETHEVGTCDVNDLQWLFVAAKSTDFDIFIFAKKLPFTLVVPTLLQLSALNDNSLDKYWTNVAEDALLTLQRIQAQEKIWIDWTRTDFKSCGCNECEIVKAFMNKKDEESYRFTGTWEQEYHLNRQNSLEKAKDFEIDYTYDSMPIVLKKLHPLKIQWKDQQAANKLLPALKKIISSSFPSFT